MIDKGKWDKGFTWNPSNCEFECNKSYNVGECSDYTNCKCRKRLINKIFEESGENIDGNKMIYSSTLNDYEKIYNSCATCIALFVIAFLIIIVIGSMYFYFHQYFKKLTWILLILILTL